MSAGWRSPGLRSATLPMALSGLIHCHRPARSGLPSAVRGAGAVRFGLPSAVRGMPGVGYVNHCAASGAVEAKKMIAKTPLFIRDLLRATVVSDQPTEFGMDTNTPPL